VLEVPGHGLAQACSKLCVGRQRAPARSAGRRWRSAGRGRGGRSRSSPGRGGCRRRAAGSSSSTMSQSKWTTSRLVRSVRPRCCRSGTARRGGRPVDGLAVSATKSQSADVAAVTVDGSGFPATRCRYQRISFSGTGRGHSCWSSSTGSPAGRRCGARRARRWSAAALDAEYGLDGS